MVVDLVAPSLPAIVKSLNESEGIVQNIISIYILGYALGGFTIGLLSDSLGRRWLLRINLLGFTVVSSLPIIFPNIEILLLTRLLQGITIGASSVLARSIIADILTSEELIKIGATIGILWGIGPVVGPVIGSYLQVYFGWQACFYFFVITAFIELVFVWLIVPETHNNPHPLKMSIVKHNLGEILSNKLFIGIVILMGLVYSLVTSFHTMVPFLIENVLHHSPIFFGHIAFSMGLIFILASMLCRYAIHKFPLKHLFFIIISGFFVIMLIGLGLSYFYPNNLNLIIVISGLMFFVSPFIYSMSMGKGMSLFRNIAGTASAVIFMNVLISSFISFCISFIRFYNIIPISWVFFSLLALSLIVYWLLISQFWQE